MAPPKDIARSYPKRGMTADVGFRREPFFCGEGSFDSTRDAGNAIQFDPDFAFTNGLSVTFWMWHDGENATRYMGFFGLVAFGSILGNTLRFHDKSAGANFDSTSTFNARSWHHVCFTLSKDGTTVKCYVDGSEQILGSQPASAITLPSGSGIADAGIATFQNNASTGSLSMGGHMAKYALYNAVLTQDQVRRIMRAQTFAEVNAIQACQFYFELAANNTDSTGNATTVEDRGTVTYGVTKPQLPRGLDLTGGFKSPPLTFDGDCVSFNGSSQGANVATTYDIAATGAKTTIAAWVNYDTATVSSAPMIVGNSLSGTTSRLGIYQTATNTLMGGCTHASGTHIQLGSTATLSAKRWYFCAATFDKDTATLKFYVDGVEFNTVTASGGGGTTGQFEIGARENGGSPTLHFGGNVAHAMMIEDVLTQGEIVELMRDTTYAKAQTFGTVNRYYELDADFNDDTGSHNATSYGSPTFTNFPANPTRLIDPSRGAAMARCFTGRAVNLDGSADYLQASSKFTSSSNNISMSMWVNIDSTRNQPIMHNGDTGVDAFLFYLSASSNFDFYYNDTSGDGRIRHQTTYQTSRWYHLVMVMDQSDTSDHQVTCYVDGVANTTSRDSAAWQGDTNFDIGTERTSGSGRFDGLVSSVKIFDVGLTQAQVRELYHNPEQVLPTGVSASNLRRYYPLSDYNDASGTGGGLGGRYFQDMGTDGATLEDKSSANMAFAQPVPCPQLGLQQSATRLYFPNTTTETTLGTLSAAPGTAMSFSLWFNMQDIGTSYLFRIGSPVASFGNSINVRFQTSKSINMFLSGTYSSGLTANFGEWNHVVITTSSSSPYWRCWVNNVEASSPTALPSALDVTATDVAIGSYISGGSSAKGIINDVALWHTELDTSDVAALYNSGVQGMDVSTVQSANLKGWWKCDDLTTLKDYSGTGNSIAVNGTFAAASFPENASGSTLVGDFSLKRKGVSVLNPAMTNSLLGSLKTSCKIPNDGTFDLNASKGFSACGFMRLQEINVYTTIFSNTTYNTAGKRLTLGMFAGSNQFRFPDSGGTNRAINFGTHVNDSDWHHLAATMDFSTNTVKLFLDGVLSTTETSFTLGSISGLGDIIIGGLRPNGQHQEGAVACVKLYQATLSDNEIKQIYNSDLRLIKGLANE